MSVGRTGRTRLLGPGWTARVSQWMMRSQIKSIQRATIAITGATSNTATVTAVDPNNSRLRFLGWSDSSTLTGPQGLVRIALTNSTTITANVVTSPGADTASVSFELIEYQPGVIKSVQRGTITDPTTTATITAVNTVKTELDYLGNTTANTAGIFTTQFTRLVLTNATTVTASSGANDGQVTGFQVVEWF